MKTEKQFEVEVKQIEVEVMLPSGRSALIPVSPEFKVQDLKHLAQLVLGQKFLKLLGSDGQLLDPMEPLKLEDGACITAIALSVQIASTKQFFALWCQGGDGVLSWGGCRRGHGISGPSFHEAFRNVQEVATTDRDFAALLADGVLVIWGSYDGDFKVKHQLQDVKRVLAAGRIFVAIHSDGTCTVVNRDLWQLRGAQPQQLCASDEKYALVLADGDVLVWDDAIGSPANRPKELAKSLMSKRVIQLQSTTKAFCVVFSDGEAIAFGDPLAGGDSGSTPLTDVKRLEASDKAFAALYENGTVAAWGHPEFGGDCSAVQHQLKDVQQIQSAGCAFAALLANGNVVTWGDPTFGGDSGHVQVQLQQVQQIYSTYYAFAALLSDRSVVTWGDPAFGGDCTEVQSQLRHVQTISGTVGAFVAICADGLMLSWGNVMFGADSSAAVTFLSCIG